MSAALQFLLFALALPFSFVAATDGDLIAVVQMFRHGQRTPVIFYNNDPYKDPSYWPAAPGQLVNEGKQQHYALGQFTRTRYADFLSNYYNSSQFYAQTTDVDRTHMSAQSNLAALWKPTGNQTWKNSLSWQPIPVHPEDTNVLSQSCSTSNTLVSNVVNNDELFVAINEEYADAYEIITNGSGFPVSSVLGASLIRDTLFIEELNGYELPSWTKSVYPEPLTTLSGYSFLSNSYTDDLKKITSGLFFRDLVSHFENMLADSTSSYKFKMYSAHDTNIAAILNTLGAFTPHAPYYASTIYFELRKKNNKGYVNIWHKDQDNVQQITVHGCTVNCNLNLFKTLMSKYIIDEDEFTTLCTPKTTSTDSVSTYGLTLTDSVTDDVKLFMNARRPTYLQDTVDSSN